MNKQFPYILSIILLIGLTECKNNAPSKPKDEFSFIFMTDIHLEPERKAPLGFKQAIDSVNAQNPDFVITGGDLIMDALGQTYGRADTLYNLYNQMSGNFNCPVYNSMGNHEIYGIYDKSHADKNNPEYGEKMFEKRIGKSYYSFEHKGWKLYILNSIEDTHKSGYIGWIDTTQMNWLKNDIHNTDKNTPIAVVTHIPFITAYSQKYEGSTIGNDSSLVVANSKDVINLFKDYNLRLVLQGHLHTVEDVFIDGIHFITGGAVCGAWWTGPNQGYQEGFMKLTLKGDKVEWNYFDYGWEVSQ